jgi:hypothetical protein
MNCPKCGSDNWKMASLVHAQGVSVIEVSTSSVGLGISNNVFGDGVGLGIGSSDSSGAQQTLLSKNAAPPERPSEAGWVLLILFIVVIIAIKGASVGLTLIIALGGFSFALYFQSDKVQKWKQDLLKYQEKKMCMRCGTFFFDTQNISNYSQNTNNAVITDKTHDDVFERVIQNDIAKTSNTPLYNDSFKDFLKKLKK